MKQGIVNTAGGIGRMLVQLLTVPVLVRYLGLESYGLWTLITATLGTLMVIEGGLSYSTTYFASRAIGSGDHRALLETIFITLTLLTLIGVMGALALFSGATWIADEVIKAPSTQRESVIVALRWSSLVLFTRLVQQVPVGLLQAFQRYGLYNLLLISQALLTLGSMVVVAWRGGGIRELMLVEVTVSVGSLLVYIGIGARLLQGRHVRLRWQWSRCREIARYSLLTWGSTLGALLFANGDRLIVGFVLGPKVAAVYSIFVGIVMRINQVSALSAQPLMPAVGGGAWSKHRDRASGMVVFAYRTSAVISVTMAMLMVSFASFITWFFLGVPGDASTVWCFQAAAIIYGIYSVNAPGYFVMLGCGHVGRSFAIVLTSGVIALSAIYVGAVNAGLAGAVLGNAGYFLTLALNASAGTALGLGALGWTKWVRVPLAWLAVCVVVNSLVGNPILKYGFVFLELVALMIWYWRNEPGVIQPLFNRLRILVAGDKS